MCKSFEHFIREVMVNEPDLGVGVLLGAFGKHHVSPAMTQEKMNDLSNRLTAAEALFDEIILDYTDYCDDPDVCVCTMGQLIRAVRAQQSSTTSTQSEDKK